MHLLRRADDLIRAARFYAEFVDEQPYAAALLAVHAVIALNDAVVLAVLKMKINARNHDEAPGLLTQCCIARHLKKDQLGGVKNLSKVIDQKDSVAYENKRFSPKQAQVVLDHFEKFVRWVYEPKHFGEILNVAEES